jgi:hypothetical protein
VDLSVTEPLSSPYLFNWPQRGHLILNLTATPSASFLLHFIQRKSFVKLVYFIRVTYNFPAASGAGSLVDPYLGYGETGALVVAAIKALALFINTF